MGTVLADQEPRGSVGWFSGRWPVAKLESGGSSGTQPLAPNPTRRLPIDLRG